MSEEFDKESIVEAMEKLASGAVHVRTLMNYANMSAIVVLAIGLALHRFIWKTYNLDLYAAGYVGLIFLVNMVVIAVLVSNLDLSKQWLDESLKQ